MSGYGENSSRPERSARPVIAYLQEENRPYREQTAGKRLRFSDEQRRRLAAKAKVLGRTALEAMIIWLEMESVLPSEVKIGELAGGAGARMRNEMSPIPRPIPRGE